MDEEIFGVFAFDDDFIVPAGIEEDFRADFDIDGDEFPFVGDLARSRRDDDAALRFILLRGIRDDDAAGGLLVIHVLALHEHTVAERLDGILRLWFGHMRTKI